MPTEPMSSRARSTFLMLRIVLSLAFIGAGAFKLLGDPLVLQEFNSVGFGRWLIYFTAALEVSGAVLLVWRRTTFYGATLLLIVCEGAAISVLFVLPTEVIHAIVLTVFLALIAWTQRHQFAVGF